MTTSRLSSTSCAGDALDAAAATHLTKAFILFLYFILSHCFRRIFLPFGVGAAALITRRSQGPAARQSLAHHGDVFLELAGVGQRREGPEVIPPDSSIPRKREDMSG